MITVYKSDSKMNHRSFEKGAGSLPEARPARLFKGLRGPGPDNWMAYQLHDSLG
jgi:hypothetical protein